MHYLYIFLKKYALNWAKQDFTINWISKNPKNPLVEMSISQKKLRKYLFDKQFIKSLGLKYVLQKKNPYEKKLGFKIHWIKVPRKSVIYKKSRCNIPLINSQWNPLDKKFLFPNNPPQKSPKCKKSLGKKYLGKSVI